MPDAWQEHWSHIFTTNAEEVVSWYQATTGNLPAPDPRLRPSPRTQASSTSGRGLPPSACSRTLFGAPAVSCLQEQGRGSLRLSASKLKLLDEVFFQGWPSPSRRLP